MNARQLASALAIPLALGITSGCSTESPLASTPDTVRTGLAERNGGESVARTYEITIENLTGGQWLTPPLIATHQGAADLFDVGESASPGVREVAENGNLAPLVSALGGNTHVSAVAVAAAGDPPPLGPGQTVTISIDAGPGARFVSFVAMLICTNDGFTGLDATRLPSRVGEAVTLDTDAYDAGSEINTEDFADLVPPCPVLTGVPSSVPGTGTSDPALAEGGVIRMHPGITGDADLQPGLHGFTSPVGRITIRRSS